MMDIHDLGLFTRAGEVAQNHGGEALLACLQDDPPTNRILQLHPVTLDKLLPFGSSRAELS